MAWRGIAHHLHQHPTEPFYWTNSSTPCMRYFSEREAPPPTAPGAMWIRAQARLFGAEPSIALQRPAKIRCVEKERMLLLLLLLLLLLPQLAPPYDYY